MSPENQEGSIFSAFNKVPDVSTAGAPPSSFAPSALADHGDEGGSIFSAFNKTGVSSPVGPPVGGNNPPETPSPEIASSESKSIFSAFNRTSRSAEAQAPERPTGEPGSIFSAFNRMPEGQSVRLSGQPSPAVDPNAGWFERNWNADPNAGFLGKAWHLLNAPIVDFGSLFGRENATGVEKGIYNVLGGLTSPLSLLLTIGTFGTSSLIESGASVALKGAGMAAEDVNALTKGSEIFTNAFKTGKNYQEAYAAVADAGLDVGKLKEGISTLEKLGLDHQDLLRAGVIRRTGSLMLRNVGLDPAKAENVAGGVQALIDAGFTVQNAYGAMVLSPRVLDAVKDGDYQKAAELATEMVASGAMAAAGTKPLLREAGMFRKVLEGAGGGLRPTEENLQANRIFGERDRKIDTAGNGAKIDEEAFRKAFKDLKADDLERVFYFAQAGLNDGLLATRGNYLAEAGGLDRRLEMPDGYVETLDQPTRNIKEVSRGTVTPENFLKQVGGAKNVDMDVVEKLRDAYRKGEAVPPVEVVFDSEVNNFGRDILSADGRHRALAAQQAGVERIPVIIKHAGRFTSPMAEEAARIQQMIDKKAIAPEEAARLVDLYDPSKLTDRHRDLAAKIRPYMQKNLEIAQQGGVLKDGVEDYLTQMWKRPDESLNKFFHDIANDGSFAVHTSMANHRVFKSAVEGQLLGNKLDVTDPIALAVNNRNAILRVIANREAVAAFLDHGLKASDGRPMAVLGTTGHTVDGHDGSNPGVFINPNGLRSVKISDAEIENLRKMPRRPDIPSDFDRFLKDGTIIKIGSEYQQPTAGIRMNEKAANISPELEKLQDHPGRTPIGSTPDHLEDYLRRLDSLADRTPEAAPYMSKAKDAFAEGKFVDARKNADLAYEEMRKDDRMRLHNLATEEFRKPIYAWSTNGYKLIDHPSFTHWNFGAMDNAGTPVLVKSEVYLHPEVHEVVARRLETQSQLSQIPLVKGALAAGREAKGILLGFSPFHMAQEGLRAIMTGISPFGIEKFDLREDPLLAEGVAHGLTQMGVDYHGIETFREGMMAGHSRLISKLPVVGKMQDWFQDFLFKRYIPGLKARAFRHLVDRYTEAYPEWTRDKVLDKAAADTNNRFGGINWKAMGRKVATQDMARMVALAPDWLESEVRFMGSLFGPEGKVARADTAKFALGLWAVSRVLNYMTTGQGHYEAPFGVAIKGDDGKEKIYSVRTLPTDLFHAASDPGEFLKGRMAPLVKAGIQTVTGRDQYGRKIPSHSMAVSLAESVAPIGLQTLAKTMSGNTADLTNADAGLKALGLSVYPYRSEATKLAIQLASNRNPDGPVDDSQIAKHAATIRLEDALRAGKASLGDVHQLVQRGQLSQEEAKRIQDNYKQTRDVPPEHAALVTRALRLPMKELLAVYDAGTDAERLALTPLLTKRKNSYLKRATKDMTPAERANDMVLARIKRLWPGYY